MSMTKDVLSSRAELPLAEIPASRGVPSDRAGVEDMAEVPACRDMPDGVEYDARASLIADRLPDASLETGVNGVDLGWRDGWPEI